MTDPQTGPYVPPQVDPAPTPPLPEAARKLYNDLPKDLRTAYDQLAGYASMIYDTLSQAPPSERHSDATLQELHGTYGKQLSRLITSPDRNTWEKTLLYFQNQLLKNLSVRMRDDTIALIGRHFGQKHPEPHGEDDHPFSHASLATEAMEQAHQENSLSEGIERLVNELTKANITHSPKTAAFSASQAALIPDFSGEVGDGTPVKRWLQTVDRTAIQYR